MKTNFLKLATATLLFAMFFSACKSKKTNTVGRYIPENAGFVFHINGESLASKLPWEEMKKNNAFLDMYQDTSVSAFAKSIMDNPENSGVNVKGDMVAFSVKDSTESHFSIEGSITDEAKFKKLLAESNKGATETTKNGYTFSLTEKASVAYNKDRFIATMADQNIDYNSFGIDTMLPKKSKADLNKLNEEIIALAENKSLALSDKFSKLLLEKGEMHFWINAEYSGGNTNNAAMGALASMSKLTEGAITTGTVNFDNGKINIDAKTYGGKELTELFSKYNGGSFNKEMLNNIPSKNLAGAFTFNFKPEGIKAFLKLLALDGVSNLALAKFGFTLDDFIKGNKGDIMFAISDLKADAPIMDLNTNYIFAASINDKTSFNKIIDAGKKAGGAYTQLMPTLNKVNFAANDKYFALSSNGNFTNDYLTGKANSNYDFVNKLGDGPMAGFMNLQYINANMKVNKTDSIEVQQHNLNMKLWDNVLISGGSFKDDAINQHWEINMMDKTTNSLKQLNNYSAEMNLISKKKKVVDANAWMNEDIVAPQFKVKNK